MKVLVACEESQRVCISFRAKGHEAYSCDIRNESGGHPEWHINTNCLHLINGNCTFLTCDNESHYVPKWDLIIAHPPCTRLCCTGQRWDISADPVRRERKRVEKEEAIKFFFEFVNADCEHIAIENPVGIMSTIYRKPDCIYNPYEFEGETDSKRTCLWLKNLPILTGNRATPLSKSEITHTCKYPKINGKNVHWHTDEIKVIRSKTPWGVAKAMAEQWG